MSAEIQKCPVCNGIGSVPPGFYNPLPFGVIPATTTVPTRETCKACGGRGIISEALAHAEARVRELEKHLEIMTCGAKGEHRIPSMREVEEARAVLKEHPDE